MRAAQVTKYAFVYIAVVLGSTFLLYPLTSGLGPLGGAEGFIVLVAVSELAGFAAFLYLVRRSGVTFRDMGFRRPGSARLFALALSAAAMYSALELQIPSVGRYAFQLDALKGIALAAAAVAGLTEEAVFRGFVVNFTREYGGLRSVLLSAALFGVAHLSWGPGGVLGTFVLGLALGYVVYAGGSVVPCVVSHALMDALIEPGLVMTFLHP